MVQHSIECSLGEDKWLIKEYKVYIFGHRCLQRFSLTKIKNGKEKNAVKHSGTASLYPQQKLIVFKTSTSCQALLYTNRN